jgi:hypothetical protein
MRVVPVSMAALKEVPGTRRPSMAMPSEGISQ